MVCGKRVRASLKRPELFRLLDIAQQGDCLLVEQVDRISRLNGEDWESLKAIIEARSADRGTGFAHQPPAYDDRGRVHQPDARRLEQHDV